MEATLGPDDATTVAELLRQVGQHRATPVELRDLAVYWSDVLEPDMEAADLQTVAWLLADAAVRRNLWDTLPTPVRDRARYWSLHLGRLCD
jgi:hypothetical protein